MLTSQHDFVVFSINVQMHMYKCKMGRKSNLPMVGFAQANIKMEERDKGAEGIHKRLDHEPQTW